MKATALIALTCVSLVLPACDWMPGDPTKAKREHSESSITDFATLYRENCLACHSDGTTTSASIPMNFPRYLKLIPVETLHDVIANGLPGTSMPGFAESTGGPLTDDQIKALVAGIITWDTGSPSGYLPSYSAPLGNIAAGETAFQTHCATCHKPGDTLLDPAYLGLVSDQYLRTVTIVGRPKLGMPPTNLTDPEVADIVAYLASHRREPFQDGTTQTQIEPDPATTGNAEPTPRGTIPWNNRTPQPSTDPETIAAPPAE